jgi:predicted TIM-barrel fold metal-dependent hydrolase
MPVLLPARRRLLFAGLAPLAGSLATVRAATAPLPLFDAHLHYSHDAWERIPPAQALALMREAGLKKAMVSSSSDEGTQKLYALAPELVVPVLRPYRSRGEIGTWIHDRSVIDHMEARLARYRYVGLGEYHVFGADAETPVMRRVVQLARQHGLLLHSHSDADAIERQFAQWPEARILWAHAGFDAPGPVAAVLRRHRRLWVDLAFRSEHASGSVVDPAWRALFDEFPERVLLGTDTFTPERWFYVGEHARWSRSWLATLPPALAERIAWKNGETMLASLPAAACPAAPAGAQTIEQPPLRVDWWPQAGSIAVSQPFVLQLALCPARAELLRVDATMPEHRHGMNYRPKLVAEGEGRWRAEGLVWHMPGRWELALELRLDGQVQRLRQSVVLR